MREIYVQYRLSGVDWAASHTYFARVIKHFVADVETQPGYLPAMEMHGSLKMLLDTLMDKQALSSWQIYEEKNGSVVVKIRFAARHCSATVTGATTSEDESSPTNVSHQHRFDETMPDLNNIMKDESPEAKQWGLIIMLFPRTYPN